MRALISIGTNSTRLLVVDGEEPVLHFARGTRIGEGLHQSGPIDPAAAQRTLAAVAEFTAIAREHKASIAGIATSALRRAADGAEFCASFEKLTGATLSILSGEEEARCSFIGAVRGLQLHGAVGVLDVGGGSSEYAYGDEEGIRSVVSCEIGAVRLTELADDMDGARGIAREALAPLLTQVRPRKLVAVGGTVFAAGAIIARQSDREALSGTTLSRADLDALCVRLSTLDLAARRAVPHMIAQRADILPAGLAVVVTAMEILQCDDLTLSTADLLYGYLLTRAGES